MFNCLLLFFCFAQHLFPNITVCAALAASLKFQHNMTTHCIAFTEFLSQLAALCTIFFQFNMALYICEILGQ